ncbi:MAG: PEGA domain-containing protein [Acidobacteriota bacterium]
MKPSRVLLLATTILVFPVFCLGQNAKEKADRNREFYPMSELLKRTEERTAAATSGSATSSARMTSALAATSHSIKSFNPAIPTEVLDHDQRIIADALPGIRSRLISEGFGEADARDVVMFAWIFLRIGAKALEPTVAFTVEILGDRVTGMGKVVIISDPDEADVIITIGGQTYTDRTVARMWLTAGTYHIRISKPNYVTLEEDCEVKKGKKTEFKRTLQAKP